MSSGQRAFSDEAKMKLWGRFLSELQFLHKSVSNWQVMLGLKSTAVNTYIRFCGLTAVSIEDIEATLPIVTHAVTPREHFGNLPHVSSSSAQHHLELWHQLVN